VLFQTTPMQPVQTPLSPHANGQRLSVVVPAYQCAGMLDRCLQGLLASDLARASWQLIVVDDGSADDATAAIAHTHGAYVVTVTDGPKGPAFARNRGVDVAVSDIVVFVDADVVVAKTTLSQFARLFDAQPDVAAAFGSYDLAPDDTGLVSQYRNLLHHWVHHRDPGPATTFWAGCGAVRRSAFREVHGFDAERFPRPQIEDVDLGYRLSDAGFRIVLDPRIQGTHLKRWTFTSMVRADLFDRAIPWMQLLRARGDTLKNGPLNLRFRERALTVLLWLAGVLALVAILSRAPAWFAASALSLLTVVVANAELFAFFARVRGPLFALRTIPLRLLFYVVCGVGAVGGLLLPPPARRFAPHGAETNELGATP
jgi:glycosyltransferase involved in cell wall biosynthesis